MRDLEKACKLLDELEKVGALERKRQGLGRPNKLSYQEVKKHHYGWDTMDFNDNVRKDFNYG